MKYLLVITMCQTHRKIIKIWIQIHIGNGMYAVYVIVICTDVKPPTKHLKDMSKVSVVLWFGTNHIYRYPSELPYWHREDLEYYWGFRYILRQNALVDIETGVDVEWPWMQQLVDDEIIKPLGF